MLSKAEQHIYKMYFDIIDMLIEKKVYTYKD